MSDLRIACRLNKVYTIASYPKLLGNSFQFGIQCSPVNLLRPPPTPGLSKDQCCKKSTASTLVEPKC